MTSEERTRELRLFGPEASKLQPSSAQSRVKMEPDSTQSYKAKGPEASHMVCSMECSGWF